MTNFASVSDYSLFLPSCLLFLSSHRRLLYTFFLSRLKSITNYIPATPSVSSDSRTRTHWNSDLILPGGPIPFENSPSGSRPFFKSIHSTNRTDRPPSKRFPYGSLAWWRTHVVTRVRTSVKTRPTMGVQGIPSPVLTRQEFMGSLTLDQTSNHRVPDQVNFLVLV